MGKRVAIFMVPLRSAAQKRDGIVRCSIVTYVSIDITYRKADTVKRKL